jgi:hypothetical protein
MYKILQLVYIVVQLGLGGKKVFAVPRYLELCLRTKPSDLTYSFWIESGGLKNKFRILPI